MKIIIAPDKFKGSLTTFEVCHAIADGIRRAGQTAETLLFPMADGGDGFAEVMKHYLKTDTIYCSTVDPLGKNIEASYQWKEKRKTAIIEMAVASGLVLLTEEKRDPLKTSTYGTGLLIKNAIGRGAERIILGLGGSATNDAGTGILSALDFDFRNSHNASVRACGENLLRIEKIIPPPSIPNVEFEIACDVQNVLYGPGGAAYTYAPQKGANANSVSMLDQGLKHVADKLKEHTTRDVAATPGTGAAGGIAAGLMSFFDVELRKGIDLIIEASEIKNKIAGADLLITGEGKIDKQTLEGKVVCEIASLASALDIPVAAFCGIFEGGTPMADRLNLKYIECLIDSATPYEEAMSRAGDLLTRKAKQFMEDQFLRGGSY